MDSAKTVLFFEEKLRALTSSPLLFPATGMSIRESNEFLLSHAKANPKQLGAFLKSLDKELDVKMRSFLPKDELARISGMLKARYGFSSLAKTGDVVAKRVLKRGSFKDDEEAQAVRDFLLSEEYAIGVIGEDKASKLELILVRYEKERGA